MALHFGSVLMNANCAICAGLREYRLALWKVPGLVWISVSVPFQTIRHWCCPGRSRSHCNTLDPFGHPDNWKHR